jgi:hypothetical protein
MKNLKKVILVITVAVLLANCSDVQQIDGEKLLSLRYEEDYTPTYYEIIDMYKKLDERYDIASLREYGLTDSGKPLHLFIIDGDKEFDPQKSRNKEKRVLMINNGIHPGEPCGIDASLEYADDMLRNMGGMQSLLDNTVICIIPVYNVGGCLYRSHFHRTNQPGPYEAGYRGNYKNLDLNRDFVKMDTENAKSFARITREWDPDVFLDTHTTNGSDHQYTITLIPSQHNSMQADLGKFFNEEMVPALYEKMRETPYELIPYPTYTNRNPESGIANYVQSAKYSTGYTQLFNTPSFMTENHCYKPYPDRVRAAYYFITSLVEYTSENGESIREKRNVANEKIKSQEIFPLSYELDTTKYEEIEFKGFGRGEFPGLLTGEMFPDYDHSKPFTVTIPFYNDFKPVITVRKPAYYILPQAWSEVVERMKINNVKMDRLSADTSLTVTCYYIENLQWSRRPDNGHFYHSEFDVREDVQTIKYYGGDYIIPVDQSCNQFIVNQLEPLGMDSYFRWNFFDNCLEDREWFYPNAVLEKKMVDYMKKYPEVRKMLDDAIAQNPEMAGSRNAQMYFLYQNVWKNPWAGRYPVTRIEEAIALPLQ